MKKSLSVLIVMLFLCTALLSACDWGGGKDKTLESISIRANSFSNVYGLDERLNFDNIYILLHYADGNTPVQMQCTEDMVKGFSSQTTGERTLYVEYQGLFSEEFSYEVVYEGGVPIATSSRITYAEESYRTGRKISLRLDIGDFAGGVSAILLELHGTPGFSDVLKADIHTENLFPAWSMSVLVLGESIRIFFYNDASEENKIMETVNFCDLIISDGNRNRTVTVKNITIVKSNGGEFRLPDAKGEL